jgi:hypothetical protein
MSDLSSTPTTIQPSFLSRLKRSIARQYQTNLDNSISYLITRWILLLLFVILYCIRVYLLSGFYIVTYGLGIFLLNLFIGFVSPLEEESNDGPLLPMNDQDEFKPFIRRLPEFKFW